MTNAHIVNLSDLKGTAQSGPNCHASISILILILPAIH